jgi:hypothetical protein
LLEIKKKRKRRWPHIINLVDIMLLSCPHTLGFFRLLHNIDAVSDTVLHTIHNLVIVQCISTERRKNKKGGGKGGKDYVCEELKAYENRNGHQEKKTKIYQAGSCSNSAPIGIARRH